MMVPLSQSIRLVEEKGRKGVFEIEALYPGYGVTVGNSLRRVLLSSLEGAAITQVKIKGVSHEFSTIPGVKEDVLGILLNLKQVRFTSFTEEPQKAVLKIKGEKEVTAGSFQVPSQVELINKDLHIATLTSSSAELEMEIQIEKGIGYVPVESLKKEKQEIGVIFLDAIFSPVQRVSFKVDHMRVGDRTDFDRLILEVETDGTMTAAKALWQASNILLKQFEAISQGIEEKAAEPERKEEKISKKKTAVKKEKPAKAAPKKKKK
ncbi:MAG: DNA-directed RNA polymerase subunit alpha [bacterium]|nr:DNA-directed RNA polymerase subunit alpha [bacterium]